MDDSSPKDVTQLLAEWGCGRQDALDQLLPVVYEELQCLAARHLRAERPDFSLRTSDLVHEAYLRLVDQRRVDWQGRTHFFGVAAPMMRRIRVDHARRKRAKKRPGDARAVPLEQAPSRPRTRGPICWSWTRRCETSPP